MRPAAALLLLFAIPAARAADPATALRDALARLNGRQAQFEQKFTPKGFKNPQIERGTVGFGAMPSMRWTYTDPAGKVFVFDGSRSWFYVEDEARVTVTTLTDDQKAALPFLLLNDPVRVSRAYKIDSKTVRGETVTTLKAKGPGIAVPRISVAVGAAGYPVRIDYEDPDGNQTVFALTNFTPFAATPSSFQFEPPPGTQIVEN